MNLLSSSVIVYITPKVNNNLTTTLLLSRPRESQQKVKENLNLSQFVKELVEANIVFKVAGEILYWNERLFVCLTIESL